jgi:hypothetical protein
MLATGKQNKYKQENGRFHIHLTEELIKLLPLISFIYRFLNTQGRVSAYLCASNEIKNPQEG